MKEQITHSLRDSKAARWTALIIVSFTMFGAYFFNYALSPVKPMLESILGWNSADFGTYTSSYTWFNVFLFMLIFSGIILDKFGVRFTGILASAMMAIGTGINYWAITHTFAPGSAILGIKMQVAISAVGFGIFGVGTEAAGITVSKAIVRWFKGYEMALAMGMQMSIARLGTALALGICLPVAKTYSYASPVLLSFVFMLIGLTAFIVYTILDKKLDASEEHHEKKSHEDEFKISDIITIITNKGFWYIAILCVLFYSAVFPFLFYATDLMINKYNVNPNLAGTIPALLPFGTIFLTPLFGTVYDRKGKGATIMIIGSIILIVVHGVLSIPGLNIWWIATLMVLLLGIGFSLVPAAMWPSVPKIIPEKQLGTAYAVIFWIQNIGLWAIPLLLGVILNSTNPQVVPNKALLKEAFVTSYTTVLNDKNITFSKDEINTIATGVSSDLIDNIVQTTNYEPVKEENFDKTRFTNEVINAAVANLNSISIPETADEFEKVSKETVINSVKPIVENAKLNIRYNYFWDLVLFTVLGILSLFCALGLKREDAKSNYGLEQPNIKA